MMSWIIDHRNQVYLLAALGLLVLIVIFWNTGRIRRLVEAGIIVGAALLFWWATNVFVTDRMQIRLNMEALADGALDHDAKKIRSLVAKDFQYHGLTADDVAKSVASTAEFHKVSNYKIWDFDVEEFSRTPEKGHAKVSFQLRVDHSGGQFPARCVATFVVENNQWRVQTFKMYSSLGAADQEFDIPLR